MIVSWRIAGVLATVMCCVLWRASAEVPPLQSALYHADDYGFCFYPYGWRGRSPEGDAVLAVQTNRYVLTFNVSRAAIERIGVLDGGASAEVAVSQGNELIEGGAGASIRFGIRKDGVSFEAVSAAEKPEQVVMQRVGRFLDHFEVRGVRFADAEDVEGWAELYCWPDRLSVTLHLDAASVEKGVEPAITVEGLDVETISDRSAGNASVIWSPGATPSIETHNAADRVQAEGIAPYTGALPVRYDSIAGWHEIELGENADKWTVERVRLRLRNPDEHAATLRLNFAKHSGPFSITGMSPMLRDARGLPLGLPVQISKNWHVRPPWFTGLTMVHLEPGADLEWEFDLAYAEWGGVPAVSHAQLALEGWGTHQLWDQMAIGSFGESICYDPDVNLGRAMIDDMRPLMVWGMGKEERAQWSWTHNVGGGDFLVLETTQGRQYLSRQKTYYRNQGPVLTDVVYAGQTPDGTIQSHIRAQSWRSDDYVRGLYTIRYEVTKPVEGIERLAFFQLAADRYNHNLFSEIARGDVGGMTETWHPEMGGRAYSRRGEPLPGRHPWFALFGAHKNPPPAIAEDDRGAWANRGLIVRHWRGRINGQPVDEPFYNVYGTEDGGIASALVEIGAPPDTARLDTGDFVEFQVEALVLPQRAEDYYGPNKGLIAALESGDNAWRLVHREASGSDLEVSATFGKVLSQWPVRIEAHEGVRTEFRILNGVGYTPVTITGAAGPGPFELLRVVDGGAAAIDQTVLGNDWWQADYDVSSGTWDLTFTLPLDEYGSLEKPQYFAWRLEK